MLKVDQDAVEDLRRISAISRTDSGRLVALIEQIKCDQQLQGRLLEHGFGSDRTKEISVSKWLGLKRVVALPVWRLKSWDLERDRLHYRIIYIYNWRSLEHVILAVVPRGDLDYDDPNHPIRIRVVQRIRRDFNSL